MKKYFLLYSLSLCATASLYAAQAKPTKIAPLDISTDLDLSDSDSSFEEDREVAEYSATARPEKPCLTTIQRSASLPTKRAVFSPIVGIREYTVTRTTLDAMHADRFDALSLEPEASASLKSSKKEIVLPSEYKGLSNVRRHSSFSDLTAFGGMLEGKVLGEPSSPLTPISPTPRSRFSANDEDYAKLRRFLASKKTTSSDRPSTPL